MAGRLLSYDLKEKGVGVVMIHVRVCVLRFAVCFGPVSGMGGDSAKGARWVVGVGSWEAEGEGWEIADG